MLKKYILPFNYFTPLSKGWGDHKFHRRSCNFPVISCVVKDATQYHNGINRVLFHPLHQLVHKVSTRLLHKEF